MNEYKHILAAVDMSPETEQLIQRAMVLRDKFQARLSMVHVVEHAYMAYNGDLSLLTGVDFDLEQELIVDAQQKMAELGERLGLVAEDCRVVIGPITEQVQAF